MKRKRLIAAAAALLLLLAVSASCERQGEEAQTTDGHTAEQTVPAVPAETLDGSEFEKDNDGLYRPEW